MTAKFKEGQLVGIEYNGIWPRLMASYLCKPYHEIATQSVGIVLATKRVKSRYGKYRDNWSKIVFVDNSKGDFVSGWVCSEMIAGSLVLL